MSVVGTTTSTRGFRPLHLGRLLQYGLAVTSIGAGLIHIAAARDHSSEPVEVALFLSAALGQLVWAGLVLRNVSKWTLGAGGILSAVLVACWALSRTTGLPILGGGVEPLGFKDGIAVLLEFAVAVGVGLLAVLPPPGRAMLVPAGRLAFNTAAVSVAALTLTALVIAPPHPGGGHGDAELAARQPGGVTETPRGPGHAEDHEAPANAAGGQAAEAPHGDDPAGTSGGADSPGAEGRRDPTGHGDPVGHGADPEGAVPGPTSPGDPSGEAGPAANGIDADAHSAHGAPGSRSSAAAGEGSPAAGEAAGEGSPATGDHSAHGAMPAGQAGSGPEPMTPAPGQGQPPAHHTAPSPQQNQPPADQTSPPPEQNQPPADQTSPPPEQGQPPAHHTTPPPQQNQPPADQRTPPPRQSPPPPEEQNAPAEPAPSRAPESQPPPAPDEDRSPAWMGRTSDRECEDARTSDPGFYDRYCRGRDGRYRS